MTIYLNKIIIKTLKQFNIKNNLTLISSDSRDVRIYKKGKNLDLDQPVRESLYDDLFKNDIRDLVATSLFKEHFGDFLQDKSEDIEIHVTRKTITVETPSSEPKTIELRNPNKLVSPILAEIIEKANQAYRSCAKPHNNNASASLHGRAQFSPGSRGSSPARSKSPVRFTESFQPQNGSRNGHAPSANELQIQQELQQLRQEHKITQKQIDALQQQINLLIQNHSLERSPQPAVHPFEARIAELRSEVQQKKLELDQAHNDLLGFQKTHQETESAIANLKAEIGKTHEKIQQDEAIKQKLIPHLEKLQVAQTRNEEQIGNLIQKAKLNASILLEKKEQLSTLENQIKQTEEEIKQKKGNLIPKQQDLLTLQHEKQKLTSQITKLSREIRQSAPALEQLQGELSSLLEKQKQTASEMVELEKNIHQAQQKAKNDGIILEQRREELAKLKKESQRSNENIIVFNDEAPRRLSRRESAPKLNGHSSNSRSNSNSNYGQTTLTEEQRVALWEKTNELASLSIELEQLKAQIDDELKNHRKKFGEPLSPHVSRMLHTYYVSKKRLEETQANLEQLGRELEQTEYEKHQKRVPLKEKRSSLSVSYNNPQFEKEIAELNREVKQNEAVLLRSQKEYSNLKKTQEETELKIAGLKQAKQEIEQKASDLKDKQDKLFALQREAEAQITSLKQEVELKKAALTLAQNQLPELKETLAKTQSRIEEQQKAIDLAKKDIQQKESVLKDKQDELISLQEKAEAQITTLKKEVELKEAALTIAQNQLPELKNTLARRVTSGPLDRWAPRTLRSIPGSSPPQCSTPN